MRKLFYLAAGRRISDTSTATKIPSRLARRSFLIVVAIAMAGGLLNPAYAQPCKEKKKEWLAARNAVNEEQGNFDRMEASFKSPTKGERGTRDISQVTNLSKTNAKVERKASQPSKEKRQSPRKIQ